MKGIVHDLETLSLKPNATILSIGAVAFDTNTPDKLHKFYVQCDMNQNRHVDLNTVLWWMQQSAEAREVFNGPKESLRHALLMYKEWCWALGVTTDSTIGVWANGSDFDNVVLVDAYKQCDLEVPWKFFQHRCYRTMKEMYPNAVKPERGTHHNALADAEYQAIHLLNILDHARLV